MATANDILKTATGELGYQESPKNSNHTKYGAWMGLDYQPWCMSFVMWCFNQNNALALLPKKTGSCSVFASAAKKAGNWRTSGYQPGDVVIYSFSHTGIVESVSGNTVTAIEGNTAVGNDNNGGEVMRRKRKTALILGAFRPAYEPESADKTLDDLAQEVIDGKWGTGETRRTRLTAAGYDAAAVQKRVNFLLKGGKTVNEIAQEVIDGKWGNGLTRTARLVLAGYDTKEVQSRVNALLKRG